MLLNASYTNILNTAIADVTSVLKTFSGDPLFAEKFALAFGTTISSEQFLQTVAALPQIEVRSDAELDGALGAFSAQTQKIYLSESLLKGDLVKLRSVLIEEIGHYLDAQVNSVDSPGDEGAIFAALVQGESLSDDQLAQLRAEDDTEVIVLDGELITVEQQITRTWKTVVNGFWDVSSNWTDNQLPLAGEDVIIGFPSNEVTTTYRTGSLALNSIVSDEAFVLSGGTLTANSLVVNNILTLSGGTLALNGTTGNKIDNLTLSGSTLTGTGELVVVTNGIFNWTSGDQSGTGKTILKGTSTLSGTGNKFLDTRKIENQGNVIWTNGNIYLNNGAIWDNTATGIFDIQGNNSFNQNVGSQTQLNNAGTLKKTGGTGTTTISTQLNNTGTVQVSTGTLYLSGGGINTATLQSNNGATLTFGGNYTLTGGLLTGEGSISLNSGTITVNDVVNSDVKNLTLSGSTLAGTGELVVVTNGIFNWTSGDQSGTGKTILKGTSTLSGTGNKFLDTRKIENQGNVIWTNGNIYLNNGAIWDNTATGIFDIQGNNSFNQNVGSQTQLNNAGTLKKTGGTGTTTISTQLNNTGTVQVSTGTLNLSGGGNSSGNWIVNNGSILQLSGNYALQSGTITGNGTVIGNVSNLTQINPGDGVGQLNISGNYTQSSTATLNIELGGTTNFDKLNITGNATLGGNLNISRVNGFAPVLGERYTILNYGGTLTGEFSQKNGLSLGNGLLLQLQPLLVNKSLVLDVVLDVDYKPGIFSFAANNFTVNENGTAVNAITINRTGGTDGVASVTLTPTNGTAIAPADYNNAPITVTFNAGEGSKTVSIPIVNDAIYEGNETLNLTLTNATGGATLGTQKTANLTIIDDESPTISLAVSPTSASVTEDDATNLIYTFTRTGNTANPLTVNFNVGGSATFNNDYTQNGAASFNGTSGSITFAAGSDTAILTIDPTVDNIFEADETVNLTLVSSANYTVGSTTFVAGTINNDDINDIRYLEKIKEFSPYIEGFQTLVGVLKKSVKNQVFSQSFPLLGDNLKNSASSTTDFLSKLENILEQLNSLLTLENATVGTAKNVVFQFLGSSGLNIISDINQINISESTDPLEIVKQALFAALGNNGGLNVIRDWNNDEQINKEDLNNLVFADLASSTFLKLLTSFNLNLLQDLNNDNIVNEQDIIFQDKSFNLKFGQTYSSSFNIDPNLGLPNLGLGLEGNITSKSTLDYSLNLTFGVDGNQKFYVDTSKDKLAISLNSSLPNSSLTGKLGFLQVDVKDKGTLLKGDFSVDLKDADNRLYLSELQAVQPENLTSSFSGKADVKLNLETKIKGSEGLPKINSDFNLLWNFDNAQTTSSSGSFGTIDHIGFDNVQLDMGSFFEFLKPVIQKIKTITEPIQPVLDFLTKKYDLGFEFSVLDIAKASGKIDSSDQAFIESIAGVARLVNNIPSSSVSINLGSFNFGNQDIRTPGFNTSSIIPQVSNTSNLDTELSKDTQAKSFIDSLRDMPGGGLSIPILTDPNVAFGLLLGKNADIFTYKLPRLDFKVNYDQFFPLWPIPPVGIRVGGGIGAAIDLGFGYDTQGIQDYKLSGNQGDIFNGFFVSDPDTPEVQFNMGLEASAELNALIARAGAGGGIYGKFDFDLNDPNDDGKVRFSEFKELLSDPRDLFDARGKVTAGIFAYVSGGIWPVEYTKRFDLGEFTLAEFNWGKKTPSGLQLATPSDPRIVGTTGNIKLTLNVGSRASERKLAGLLIDVAEVFDIKHKGGGAGNESLEVSGFQFTQSFNNVRIIEANAGNDNDQIILADNILSPAILSGGNGNDIIYGGAGNDFISGNNDKDNLQGRAGDDTLRGGGDDDYILGGLGKDSLYGDSEDDFLDGGEDDDRLEGGSGIDILIGGIGNDFIKGEADNDTLYGDAGGDTLDGGDGNDNFSEVAEADEISGGAGTDSLTLYGLPTGTTVDYRDPNNGTTSAGGSIKGIENFSFRGNNTAGNDNVNASGADYANLYGEAGDDILIGGKGNDYFDAGTGVNQIDGGNGSDAVSYDQSSKDSIVNIDETKSYSHTGYRWKTFYAFAISSGKSISWANDTLKNLENIIGSAFNDILIGNAFDNHIFGQKGNDFLVGNGGMDTLDGGEGIDIVSYGFDLSTQVYVNLSQNTATDSYGKTDTLLNIENVIGSDGQDTLIGNDQANTIEGGQGNDTIEGKEGNDRLYGSEGNDSLSGELGEDTLFGEAGIDILKGGEGNDSLEGGTENDFLYGEGGIDTLKGGSGADLLFGGTEIDLLYGEEGNDTLYGEAGNDTLYGGIENDSLYGGEDNDSLFGESGIDTLKGGIGNDFLEGGTDNDFLYGEGDIDTLKGGFGADQLFGGTEIDLLYGEEGNDTLYGEAGNDTLYGGIENDSLYGGEDNDSLFGESGIDTLKGGTGNDSLEGGTENDFLYGEGDIDTLKGGFGADQLFGGTEIDLLYGEEGDDTLYGEAGNDTLYGGIENDFLYGGEDNDSLFGESGVDTLKGGTGNDSLEGGTDNDLLYGEGDIDTLKGGFGADQLFGGTEIDLLYGEEGDDTLYGEAGNDTLYGGIENDFLYGGEDNDSLFGEEGNDTLYGGVGNDSIVGGIDNDTLYGEDGRDLLWGSEGNDLLEGGKEDDILRGEAGNDLINGGEGNDLIFGSRENQFLFRNDDDTLNGGSGDDTIHPGWRDDLVDGGEGIDLLVVDYSTLPTQSVTWVSGNEQGRYFIYVANAYEIGDPIRTHLDANGSYEVAISADGTTLATGTSGNPNIHGTWVQKIDGLTPPVRVNPSLGINLSLSEDGSYLVGSNYGYDIFWANTDGSQSKWLTDSNFSTHSNPSNYSVVMSDDGKTVAWISNNQLFTADLQDATLTNIKTIYTTAYRGRSLSISADGSRLAWESKESEQFWDYRGNIYVVNKDGTGLKTLLPRSYNMRPSISGDGSRVIWSGSDSSWIYVNDYATSSFQGSTVIQPAAISHNAALSFDGKRFAYQGYDKGHSRVYLGNIDGTEPPILIADDSVLDTTGVNGGPALSEYVNIGVRYASFDLTTGNGEINTWGPSRIRYSSIERFDLTGTIYGDKLLGGNFDDILTGNGGVDTLQGGLGNDRYRLTAASNGGSTIEDIGGIDSLELTDITLTLTFPTAGLFGLRQSHTSLLIDLNQDGLIKPKDDLTILNFFDVDGNAGSGFIETVDNLSGTDILQNLHAGNDAIAGDEQNNFLNGRTGNDQIFGGLGNDSLDGDGGDDKLNPGWGDELVDGGEGTDTLVLDYTNLPTRAAVYTRIDGPRRDTFIVNGYGMGSPQKIAQKNYNSSSDGQAFSADGTTYAYNKYISIGHPDNGLWVQKLHNAAPPVRLSGGNARQIALSKDGETIVWWDTFDLYTANTDGSGNITKIPNFLPQGLYSVNLSSDGNKIGWFDSSKAKIILANIDGSNRREIGKNLSVGEMRLSSDNSQIIWIGSYNGQQGIWRIDAETNTTPIKLAGDTEYNALINISSDGQTVLWRDRNSLLVNTPNTHNNETLLNSYYFSIGSNSIANISPDGKTAAFFKPLTNYDIFNGRYGLYITDLNDAQTTTLIAVDSNISGSYGIFESVILSTYVDAGVRYTAFDTTTGSGEITTWGPSRVKFSNVERFDIIGTPYGDELRGGNLNDKLTGGGGADTLKGSLGDDQYILTAAIAAGTNIEDTGGNDTLILTDLDLDLAKGLAKFGTSLLIDLNQDGLFTLSKDLRIIKFFNGQNTSVGIGFIETIDNLSGTDILDKLLSNLPPNQNPVTQANKTVTLLEDAQPTSLQITDPTDPDYDDLILTITAIPDSSKGQILLADNTIVNLNTILEPQQLTSLVFTPIANTNGSAGTFSYTISDQRGGTATQSIKLQITSVNDTPILTANTGLTLNEGATAILFNVVLNSTDADNTPDQLTYSIFSLPKNGSLLLNNINLAVNGTFTQTDLNNNLLKYQHNGSETSSDSFKFTLSDGSGGTLNPTTFNLNIVDTDGTIEGNVWNDVNGNAIKDAGETGLIGWTVYLDTNQNHQLDNGETFVQTREGGAYTFSEVNPGTYTVAQVVKQGWQQTYPSTNLSGSNIEVSIGQSVTGIDFGSQDLPNNELPTLNNINKTGNEDSLIQFNQVDFTTAFNDTDGDTLVKIKVITTPNNGFLQLNNANISLNQEIDLNDLSSIRFSPNANFNGLVNFKWNGFGGELYAVSPATVNISLNPVDDAPDVANPIANITVNEHAVNTLIDLSNLFRDIDSDAIFKSIFFNTNTSLVTASIINNQLTLDYLENQFGEAQITIRGTADGQFVDNIFTVTVNPVNDALTIISSTTTNFAENGTGIAYTVTATDPEGTTLTYGLLNSDADASLFNINSTTGAITFKTAPDFETPLDSGADNTYNLTVTANDGSLTSSKAVALTVTNLNEIQGNPLINNGRNPIVGTAGPDYLTGGAGAKTLTGGGGNDSFVFTNMRDVGQRIADFTVGEDKLVFTQLFSSLGYKGSNPIADGYIKFVQGTGANSAHTFLQIDRDGLTGSAIARNFLQVDNITPTQLNNINNFQF